MKNQQNYTKYIYPSFQSTGTPRELIEGISHPLDRNSCAVTALMNFLDIAYEEADRLCTAYGRKRNCGMLVTDLFKMLEAECKDKVKLVGIFGTTYGARFCNYLLRDKALHNRGTTLGTFLKKHPRGTHLLFVTGHMTVVKDGVVFDLHRQKTSTSVCCVWKRLA